MTAHAPLTFVEELVLLALDDTTGAPLPMPPMAFSYAVAGALLCDLALQRRIDTDPTRLTVLSATPTGDPLLDPALALIAAGPHPEPVSRWLGLLSENARAYERAAEERLVAHGILRREEKRVLWVFGVRRYPTVDAHERVEVRTRLAGLILGDELPDPRDAMLIGVLTACQLAGTIFAGPVFNARGERLATLAKMDLVGREVAAALDSITAALRSGLPLGM
jgi:hypothetical protein